MTERVNNVVKLVKELDEHEKLELIRQLIDDSLLFEDYEDLQDALLIEARRNEPAEDYEEFIEKLRREGRPV